MAAVLRQTQQWNENTNFRYIESRENFSRRGTSTADPHRYCGEAGRNQCGTLDNHQVHLVANTDLLTRAARKKGENEMLSASCTHVTRASTSPRRIAGMPAHSSAACHTFTMMVLAIPSSTSCLAKPKNESCTSFLHLHPNLSLKFSLFGSVSHGGRRVLQTNLGLGLRLVNLIVTTTLSLYHTINFRQTLLSFVITPSPSNTWIRTPGWRSAKVVNVCPFSVDTVEFLSTSLVKTPPAVSKPMDSQ